MNQDVSRIALFGGSFDPPHTGHLAIAQAAIDQCGLERVIFVPCRESPLKGRLPGATGDDRLTMLRLATAGLARTEISDWELSRPGPSYSWQTAEHFADRFPGFRLCWLMGEDQWAAVDRWARPDFLRARLTFIVFGRDGHRPKPRDGWDALFLSGEFPGSSTEVRRLLAEGRSAPGLLSPAVEAYISRAGLYRGAGETESRSSMISVSRKAGSE